MFRAVTLLVVALGLFASVLTEADLRAQGQCAQCDLPPGCRGQGNQNGNGGANSNNNRNGNCQPLTITIESDIDFGRLVLLGQGEGRVILDLSTGQKTLIGDVDDMGGMPITGRAIITGAPFEEVVIDLPGEIAMRDVNGGTARVNDFTTDLSGFPRLDANGQLEFRFSGTLVIGGDATATGSLRGRVPITVNYP